MCMTFAKSTNDLHFSDSQLKHDWNYFLTICVKNTNQIKIIKSGTKKENFKHSEICHVLDSFRLLQLAS